MGIKERPILFSGPMVRALLAGQKTVTRRVVKGCQIPKEDTSEPIGDRLRWTAVGQHDPCYGFIVAGSTAEECAAELAIYGVCPYGRRGERLWVRETYQVSKKYDAVKPRDLDYERGISTYYAAGGSRSKGNSDRYVDFDTICVPDWVGKMRPSIFMPRAACRILLEITDVRVERLQDISEEQARAEGITDGGCTSCGNNEPCGCDCPAPSAIDSFCHLWGEINGPHAWDANPWVWVVEFKRVMP